MMSSNSFVFFIAKRISARGSDNLSGPVVRISVVSVALGVVFMLLSIAIVIGFQKSISDKVTGFTSHLQIVPFDNNESLESAPIATDGQFIDDLKNNPEVTHLQFTARKAGVLKTDDQIQGVIFKGVDKGYDSVFLKESLVEGRYLHLGEETTSNEVLVSALLASKLHIKIGDDIRLWFVQEGQSQPRGRKLNVSGIYSTSLEEFDNNFIIGDLKHIRKLNEWKENEAGAIEIMLKNEEKIRETAFVLNRKVPYDMTVVTVLDAYPQIYNWLDLLDMNVVVILTLLILVASITLISTLLIIIIERTNMVGLLKSLGATNRTIQKIFLIKTGKIVFQGMIWGNAVGILLIAIQHYFKIIKLSPESYYIDYVPVEISVVGFLLLNTGILLVTFLVLVIPAYTITHINPAKALRYN
ncbi:MAG: ABC transporter permease [Bacteroidetes bacterium]|nr:ABC transporter permease [Bacteroidota bacterium]